MNKPLHHYKMVYFDASDTLLTISTSKQILQQYMAARSIFTDEDHIGELFAEAFRLFYYEKPLTAFEKCTPESDRTFWVNLYKYVLDKLLVQETWTEEQILVVCDELYDIYTSPEHYHLFDDVKACLERLTQKGIRLGIVSNFAPTLKAVLDSLGILAYFEHVIVSTEAGLEKPDPAIFTLAIELSGLKASEILYVGDHELNDIWAPSQVGMDAVQINRYQPLLLKGIQTLHELFED